MATLCGPIGKQTTEIVEDQIKTSCDPDGNFGKMFLAEIIGTFLFVSVNVNIIYNNGSEEIILNAIIIGLALCVGIMVAAPTSGAAINPGVGIVQPLF